ncbi:MAG: hypothetical protein ACLP1E_08715 [Acidimicrobiales bacterium]
MRQRELDPEPTWLERMMRERVVVHTLKGDSIEGLLSETGNDGVVLHVAVMLQREGNGIPLAGEIWIPREQVAFAQLAD